MMIRSTSKGFRIPVGPTLMQCRHPWFVLVGLLAMACSGQGVNTAPEKTETEKVKSVKSPRAMMIQALIDHESLKPYYHPELEERSPLVVVSSETIPVNVRLRKFGKDVRMQKSKPHKGPYLHLTNFIVDGKNTTLRFEYAVEGVVGIARFEGVTLTSVDVAEQSHSQMSVAPSVIESALGPKNLQLLREAERFRLAKLKVSGFIQAQKKWLKNDAEIGGFAATTPFQTITNDGLVELLIDDKNHDFNRSVRCANDYYIGLRWQNAEHKIEFLLGMKCHQAFFIFPSEKGTATVGGLLNPEVAQKLVAAVAD